MAVKAASPSRIPDILASIVSVIMVLYVCMLVFYLPEGPIEFENTFLGLSFIVFLMTRLVKPNKGFQWVVLALLVLAMLSTGYIKVFYQQLEWRRGFPTVPDLIAGTALLVVVIEASRRAFGIVIPAIVCVLLLYSLFGHYIPEPLGHGRLEFDRVISAMDIGLVGIYGDILYACVYYVFLFLVFGSLLQLSGAIEFFYEIGKLLSRTSLKSAPAQAAVASSALVGMISGTPIANAGIVGPFTIPLMKKAGFTPEQAGGVEAAASTGGAIMPPVMGAVAFIMAEILGVPYVTVMIAAFIPAFLYFLSVGVCVEMAGRKADLKPLREPLNMRLFLTRTPLFVIPLGVIVVLLLRGYTPLFSAFWAIVSLFGLSLLRKETRISPRRLVVGLKGSAISGAELALLGACLGPLTATVTYTGLAVKVGSIVEMVSGGNMVVALLMTALVSIVLGTALPVIATYVIVAVIVAPVLISWGVGALEAHFFVLWFGVLSAVTPPTAPPALVTSRMAGGDFLRTSIWASIFALPSFIIPFIIIKNPALIAQFSNPVADSISILSCILAIFALSITTIGYYLTKVGLSERALYGLATVALFGYAFTNNGLFFAVGAGLFLTLTLWQRRQWKRGRALQPALPRLGNQ